MTDLELEIRAHVGLYMRGQASLTEFHRWFASATWNVHKTGHKRAIELAYWIDGLLAKYSSGEMTERQLRARLTPMIDTYHFEYGEPDERTYGTGVVADR